MRLQTPKGTVDKVGELIAYLLGLLVVVVVGLFGFVVTIGGLPIALFVVICFSIIVYIGRRKSGYISRNMDRNSDDDSINLCDERGGKGSEMND